MLLTADAAERLTQVQQLSLDRDRARQLLAKAMGMALGVDVQVGGVAPAPDTSLLTVNEGPLPHVEQDALAASARAAELSLAERRRFPDVSLGVGLKHLTEAGHHTDEPATRTALLGAEALAAAPRVEPGTCGDGARPC